MLAQSAGSVSGPLAQSQIGPEVANDAQPPHVPPGPCTQVTDPSPTCTMPTKSTPKDQKGNTKKHLRSSTPPQSIFHSPTLLGPNSSLGLNSVFEGSATWFATAHQPSSGRS